MDACFHAWRPLSTKAFDLQASSSGRSSFEAAAHERIGVSTAKFCRRLFMSRPVLIQSDAEDHYRAKDN